MERSDFVIGRSFWCGGSEYRCTDIGSRVVVAIPVGDMFTQTESGTKRITASEAAAKGWFRGPPYAVAEVVFDENDFPACSPEQDHL